MIQTQNLDPDTKRDEIDINSEDVDDSYSCNQHRKNAELIATRENGDKVQNMNKQTKTSLSNHNSKNKRRKKLRKT